MGGDGLAQILALYSLLTRIDDSPVVALGRAIAGHHVVDVGQGSGSRPP